jgi:murein L,D-transpeptidase YcbB/YkuD
LEYNFIGKDKPCLSKEVAKMRWRWFLVIPFVLILAGCATGRRLQSLETKMDVLESKVNSIEQRQTAIEGQTGESRESEGYLKGKLENVSHGPSTEVVTGTPAKNGGYLYKSGKISLTNKDIQIALKNAGLYNGQINGKIGKKTKRAIREFQKANGLKADGKVGPKTKDLLLQYLKQETK